MTESARKINRFERRVAWRMRLLALQDLLALALLIGGILSAAAVLYIRLRPFQFSVWTAAAVLMGIAMAAASARWFMTRATERDAAFEIDQALDLEDRLTTAQAVIERGGPHRTVETALVDDAAERVATARPSQVTPYHLSYRHILGLVGIIFLVAAVMIPERSLPGGEALAAAREDIQAAGEQLEQTAEEVEQITPPGTETAGLAKEQAELGRALRRSVGTRAEALKKLSALEERIRQRHDELAETRADEIVSLAEKRFDSALFEKPKAADKLSSDEDAKAQTAELKDAASDTSDARKADAKDKTARPTSAPTDSKQADKKASGKGDKPDTVSAEKKDAPEAKPSDNKTDANQTAANPANDKAQPTTGNRNPNQKDAATDKQSDTKQDRTGEPGDKTEPQTAEGDKTAEDKPGDAGEQQKTEGGSKMPGATPNFLAEQATKSLSGELLKKADQLRADQLSPEDIKRLAQAAESLAKDLAPLAQSKEFQKSLEQLARQVNPEQLEQVARELMSREDIRKELEAAARLLMQNRQAKEIAAGLAQKFGDQKGDMQARRQPGGNEQGQTGEGGLRRDASQKGAGTGRNGSRLGKSSDENRLTGRGKETSLSGQLQRKPGGEYLYLEARPGAGAARAPYSSVYPQYRRQAERSVERSQIPLRYRSVIRDYFDAINPDVKKKKN